MSGVLWARKAYDVSCNCGWVKRVKEGDPIIDKCPRCGSTLLDIEEAE